MEQNVDQGKKNKSVKGAILLIGAVLITTSLLGGTLAKYVSVLGEVSDSARVAKWQVTQQDKTLDMFKTAYDGADGAAENTVQSKDGKKVIAPGTAGEVIITPEISDAELEAIETAFVVNYSPGKFSADKLFANYVGNWNSNLDGTSGSEWLPLRFSFYGYDESAAGQDKFVAKLYDGIGEHGKNAAISTDVHEGNVQLDELNRLLTLSGNSSVVYPNDSLADKKEKLAKMGFKLKWEWPFERPETGSIDDVDGRDTVVGNRAANSATAAADMPSFEISMKSNAVQVD